MEYITLKLSVNETSFLQKDFKVNTYGEQPWGRIHAKDAQIRSLVTRLIGGDKKMPSVEITRRDRYRFVHTAKCYVWQAMRKGNITLNLPCCFQAPGQSLPRYIDCFCTLSICTGVVARATRQALGETFSFNSRRTRQVKSSVLAGKMLSFGRDFKVSSSNLACAPVVISFPFEINWAVGR